VIIVIAVVAVVFSFFWVFVPVPRWLSNAMGRSPYKSLQAAAPAVTSPEIRERHAVNAARNR
jgi:hypothetical protein